MLSSRVVLLSVCLIFLATLNRFPLHVNAQAVAVPSYINPGNNDWQLITAASGKVSFALINPYNGPGLTISKDYLAQVQKTRAAGIPVYGYVHSTYGKDSLDVIQRNITTYYGWYPIDGIFVDEAAIDCAAVGLYQNIYNFVKSKGGTVVINPGGMTNECYMSTADIILIAENRWDLYLAPYVPPAWVFKYAASRFWHVVWGVPQSDIWKVIHVANSRNAGYVFVTDAGGANPYNRLPLYWSALLNKQMYTTGVSLDGGASTSSSAPNLDACDWKCKTTAGCTGWTYDVCGSGTCWLTTSGGSIVPKTCRAAVQHIASSSIPAKASGLSLTTSQLIGKYNFGPIGSASPDGYQLDSGAAFGAKGDGHSYGWNAVNTNAFKRDSALSPSPAHDSGIRMQVNGWQYRWEIAVPIGYYSVHVVAGDPMFPACQEMAIEGTHLISGCPSAASPWVEYTGVVYVTDGRLSITNVADAQSDNKLCFVEISTATGTVLSATLSSASQKRQLPVGAANVTFEQRFIDALCTVTHQPPERFRILSTIASPAGTTVTVDYLVLDPDLIPDPNVTRLATEVATAILKTEQRHWSDTGLKFVSQQVVLEQGSVPKRYNKAESIALFVTVGLLGVAVCLLAGAIAAFFIIQRQRSMPSASHNTRVAVGPPSEVQLVGTASSPGGSTAALSTSSDGNVENLQEKPKLSV